MGGGTRRMGVPQARRSVATQLALEGHESNTVQFTGQTLPIGEVRHHFTIYQTPTQMQPCMSKARASHKQLRPSYQATT